MKMTGKQFKNLIKECLKELIQEGHFQQMMVESMAKVPQAGALPVQPSFVNPNIAALVNDMSKGNPNTANSLLEIFADTAANHPHVHGDRVAQLMGNVSMAGSYHQTPSVYQQHGQYGQMLNEQQVHQQSTTPQPPKRNPAFASRWAELAFSKSQKPGF